MQTLYEERDTALIVNLQGDVTRDHTEILQKQVLLKLVGQLHDLIVDLTEVNSVDSATLETLLWMDDHCASQLGQLRLCGASKDIQEVLKITNLQDRLSVHEHVNAAMDSLAVVPMQP